MISFSSNNPRVVWINPYFTDGKLELGNRKIAQEDKSSTRARIEIAKSVILDARTIYLEALFHTFDKILVF